MRKFIAALLSASFLAAYAGVDEPNQMVIHFKDGSQKKIDITDADYMEFQKVENPGEDPTVDLPAPKVGDYFYSDGTWSDGGLISIEADGRNAVWSATKPAPVDGKTVVGIVFCTNPDRMGETEKAKGFTRGYVIGCKNIIDTKKKNYDKYPESVWFASQYAYTNDMVQINQVSKTAKSCYENLSGYDDTWNLIYTVTEVDNNNAEYIAEDIPMFYNGTGDRYPVAAPANTSGWFIPSVGQMWDCVANFCSGEVAEFLAKNQTNTYDFTYYCSKTDLSSSPFETFMKPFELVPITDKDEININDEGDISKGTGYIKLATATRYDDEARVVIDLGMQGNTLIEGMAGWFDEEAHARPILAF